ncbi:MAG: phage tail tape measure protein [Pseudorhodoplanes sp.]|nr:MAG: phage tail tape measure protein [Pseudorhodoplanes sp.]
MADGNLDSAERFDGTAMLRTVDSLDGRLQELTRTAALFSRLMTAAFVQSATGARSFEEVLKSLYLRLSDLAVRAAFKPLERGLATGFTNLFAGLLGGGGGSAAGMIAATGAVKPFAAGGVIGTPTYFPLLSGGVGLAGEAGPEAILPLARGADGRLGVASAMSAAPATVVVNIATPDAESFRRSESFITGQIARAVARGQRGL